MSSGCGDVLSLEDLKTAKKHQLFEAEVITGRAGGVATGSSIDYATNQATGQVQKTMPAILRDIGYRPASFDFVSGGTIGVNDRDLAVLWPLPGGDGDWYFWEGALPKVIPANSTPASTGGVANGAWRPVGDIALRTQLAGSVAGDAVVDAVHLINDTTISFRTFLTVKDGSVDGTAAMAAACASGATVTIPADYKIRLDYANITVAPGTKIIGEYGGRPTILINHTNTTQPQFVGAVVNTWSNIRFRYPLQKLLLVGAETPIPYGALFEGAGYYCEFSNLDIGNAYYAFKFGDATLSSSKITMFNIIGAPLFRGLSLDACLDVPRISDIHWNYNFMQDYALPGENYTYDVTLRAWMQNNATAFHVGRCDFATFFRLFSYGYWRGIYLRSERRAGSAENTRFVGCDQDICVHPLWLQNWENRVSILDCKLVGSTTSPHVTVDNSFNQISDVGSTGAECIIDNVYATNYTNNAFQVGCNLVMTNSTIKTFGIITSQQGNGIIQTGATSYVTLSKTIIDCGTLSGRQTRSVFSNTSTGRLVLDDGCRLLNNTLASYDWRTGGVIPATSTILGGSGHGGLSFIVGVPTTYYSSVAPTTGNYFKVGDTVEMTVPVKTGFVGQPNYVIFGWKRLTNSLPDGSNHVMNTDWVELRTYFNGVS